MTPPPGRRGGAGAGPGRRGGPVGPSDPGEEKGSGFMSGCLIILALIILLVICAFIGGGGR